MVRVVTQGRFRVYMYAEKGGKHNAPHCHVDLPERTLLCVEQGRYTLSFKACEGIVVALGYAPKDLLPMEPITAMMEG